MPSGKFIIGSMAQYVLRNPFTTAASVVAPLFAKDEDRGYFRTAAMTTPAILAVGAYAPGMFVGAKGLAEDLKKAHTLQSMQAIFKHTTAQNIVDQQVASAVISSGRNRNFIREQRELNKLFKGHFVVTEDLLTEVSQSTGKRQLKALARLKRIQGIQSNKGRLLSLAMHSARRTSLSPSEWNSEAADLFPLDNFASGAATSLPDLNNEQLIATFEKYETRPNFRTALKQRLREINRLEYSKTITSSISNASAPNIVPFKLDFDTEWGLSEAEKAFKAQSPQVWENLRIAKSRGLILDPQFAAEVSKDVVSGKVGRVLSVSVTRRSNLGELSIPIVDRATGQVRLGKQFENVGVGTHIMGLNSANQFDAYPVDEWVSRMLAERSHLDTEVFEKEISAHAYWMPGDPLDLHRKAELEALGVGGENISKPLAIRLRHKTAGITTLPIFPDTKGNLKKFDELTTTEQMPYFRQAANSNKFIAMGNEASPYEMRYQLREAAFLNPLAAPNAEKQDPFWRILTKEFSLSAPNGLPQEATLGWMPTSWRGLAGELPLAKGITHMMDPQDRTMFADLPLTDVHLEATKDDIIRKFQARGMSEADAQAMYRDIHKLYEGGNQGTLHKFGRMGESVTLMDTSFADQFKVEGIAKYEMDARNVKVGDQVGPNTVLGELEGMRVLPKNAGQVVSLDEVAGRTIMNIRSELGMEGAKADIGGVKGMNLTNSFDKFRDLLNSYYQRIGSGKFISPDVNIIGTSEYLGAKLDPVQAYLGLGTDLANRLIATKNPEAAGIASGYLQKMNKAFGAELIDGQMILNSSTMADLTNSAMSQRILDISQISEDMFTKAGNAIRKAHGYNDLTLTAFASQEGEDYVTWMQKNRIELPFGTWDHSMVNVPTQVQLGYDFESYMTLNQNFKGLEAVRGRLQTISGGNPKQSIEFMKYVMGGDFTKEIGTTIPLSEAFKDQKALKVAGNRAGTIFDPFEERFKQNFRVDLGGGKFLPVPGTAAYGAEAPLFGPGEYQTHSWQHTLQDLAFAKTAEKKSELEKTLMMQYKSEFGIGKGSALRPYQYDPMSTSGILGVASERGDPFVARVGDDFVNRIHSKRVRDAMKSGDIVLGLPQRQPTNELMYLKYRYDPTFSGTMDVGMSEAASRMLYGDVDRDLTNNIFIDAHIRMENGKMVIASAANDAERAAAQEGIEALASGGRQERAMKAWQKLHGTNEIANLAPLDWNTGSKLADRAADVANKVTNRAGVAINRTAGATIGQYSNVLTEVVEQMLRNSAVTKDPDLITRLRMGLFEIRQAPISARKVSSFSAEHAVSIVDQFRKGLAMNNSTSSAEHIQSLMMRLSQTFKQEGAMEYWGGQGSEDLKVWASGRTDKARLAAQALRIGKGKASRQAASGELLEDLFRSGIEETLGVAHGGRAATGSAARLGEVAAAISSRTESATGSAGKIFAKHGKKLAIGLGALAALGVAMTPRQSPVASFSRASGNKYRPEDRMGVSDTIPGEPMAGQMATSPPRREGVPPPNVRTTVIAPMGQTTDLSVRMRAIDQSRAAETTRQISMIPGSGDTNVTVNYKDRTRIGSLRNREKMRRIMQ